MELFHQGFYPVLQLLHSLAKPSPADCCCCCCCCWWSCFLRSPAHGASFAFSAWDWPNSLWQGVADSFWQGFAGVGAAPAGAASLARALALIFCLLAWETVPAPAGLVFSYFPSRLFQSAIPFGKGSCPFTFLLLGFGVKSQFWQGFPHQFCFELEIAAACCEHSACVFSNLYLKPVRLLKTWVGYWESTTGTLLARAHICYPMQVNNYMPQCGYVFCTWKYVQKLWILYSMHVNKYVSISICEHMKCIWYINKSKNR